MVVKRKFIDTFPKLFANKKLTVSTAVALVFVLAGFVYFGYNMPARGKEVALVPVEVINGLEEYIASTTATRVSQVKLTPVAPKQAIKTIDIPILMYHYVKPHDPKANLSGLFVDPKIFEEQLKTLKDAGYQSLSMEEVGLILAGRQELPKKPIAITFDDGYEDAYTTALPILEKYGFKATLYVIVNALDKPGYVTSNQIREMATGTTMEIGAHTLNHSDLNKASEKSSRTEVIGSKKKLEEIIGQPVYDFAYPFGLFSGREENFCEQAGYLACVTTGPGYAQSYEKRFAMYRLRPANRVGADLLAWLKEK